MSEARALSDKLKQVQEELRQTREQLDKQRTQHAREQEVLRKRLEETRREAARLRERVEEAVEERRREQVMARVLAAAPSRDESADAAADVLVALARAPASVEQSLPVLSRLLRLSPVDTRLRLTLSQPAVLARLPALEAEMLRDMLIAEGFSALTAELALLTQGLTQVRRFTLEERALGVESLKGERQQLPYSELRLLVRGRRKTTTVETQVERVYDPVYDVREVQETKLRHDHLENFLWVYGDGAPWAFTEETSYAGLGAPRATTRFATMQIVVEELRKRAPQVVVDERFLRGPRPSLLMVGPERSQEVLAGLTCEAIKAGMWP